MNTAMFSHGQKTALILALWAVIIIIALNLFFVWEVIDEVEPGNAQKFIELQEEIIQTEEKANEIIEELGVLNKPPSAGFPISTQNNSLNSLGQ